MHDQIDSQLAKILIVDDTLANIDLLRNLLMLEGYSIFFATSGAQALKVDQDLQPDLILLDVMMPELDGFATCRQFKALEALCDIPVIFVTARTEVEDLARGFETGAVDYVTKPVKRLEVLARVKTHLQLRGLIKQQQANLEALDQANQELELLNETKDKFLSNLGKEVKTAAMQLCSKDAQADAQDEPDESQAEEVLRLLETILEWPRLQTGQKLDLLATQISDQELGNLLASLHDLRFLSLAETKVGDAGLQYLTHLNQLKELILWSTQVTREGAEALQQALPECDVSTSMF